MKPFPLALMEGEAAIQKRIEAGKAAVEAQIPFFQRLFGNVDSQWKADRSRVTEADLTISRETEARILAAFPEDQFFSEETQDQTGPESITSEFVWIIDPVDGTNNFALGMSMCAISLGLLRNGVPVYGFIYDASRQLIMRGGRGRGAFEGEAAMSPSIRTQSNELFVAFDGFSSDRLFNLLVALKGQGFKMRNVGSGTLHLAYTANGLMDGSFSNRVSVWDIAAAYAFCEAVGTEFHFFDESIFPMTEFWVKAPKVYYYAGTSHFCRTVESIWKAAGVFPVPSIAQT
ncbi:MAG: inositol monophosphatase [Verrucomicrobia bacterium]|nr:inositol monophosphatase [Verrucomicrobiota bacterium]